MEKKNKIWINAGETKRPLLELLLEHKIFLTLPCGGQGRCGKCQVRFWKGAPEPTEKDRAIYSEKKLKEGWRLACTAVGEGQICVEIPSFLMENEKEAALVGTFTENAMAAIDVGTTALAAVQINPATGKKKKSSFSINHQRSFGADVISRIQAACRGKGEELQRILWDDLMDMIAQMGLSWENTELVLSGNTTMGHLLQGYPCETLGRSPYRPVDLSCHFFSWKGNDKILFLPGISTFVGADMVSGIVATGMQKRKEISLLIDVGTNGEIALGNQDKLIVTSAAAGPAFEGGNISCGMAAVPGAVSRVEIRQGKIQAETIGHELPCGICGTGVLELTAALLEQGWIGMDGRLSEKYLREGIMLFEEEKTKNGENVIFTQKDIREVQYAKAALRTGIEILLKEYGISYEAVDCVFLAGSFGQAMDVQKAITIGLLPKEWKDRIVAAGNTSLKGACMLLAGQTEISDYVKIQEMAQEIPLAQHPDFQEKYLNYMWFPESENQRNTEEN